VGGSRGGANLAVGRARPGEQRRSYTALQILRRITRRGGLCSSEVATPHEWRSTFVARRRATFFECHWRACSTASRRRDQVRRCLLRVEPDRSPPPFDRQHRPRSRPRRLVRRHVSGRSHPALDIRSLRPSTVRHKCQHPSDPTAAVRRSCRAKSPPRPRRRPFETRRWAACRTACTAGPSGSAGSATQAR